MRIDLTLPSRPESVAQARRALDPLAEEVPDVIYKDTRLLVSELVTNSVRHVAPERAADIRLVVERMNGRLRVEVHDRGDGIGDWEPRPQRDAKPHGWGLELLDRLSTRWGTARRDGSVVWFEISTTDA